MYTAFEKLPDERKILILKICIEEFAENGYEKTSTDKITSRAGISKGILFHYFKSKKNLFLYIVHHIYELLTIKVIAEIEKIDEQEFFKRIKLIILAKQKITLEYLLESQLFINVLANPPVAIKSEIEEMYVKHLEKYGDPHTKELVYLQSLLGSLELREGVDHEHVMNITMYTLEKLQNKYLALYKNGEVDILENPEPMLKEFDSYIEIIKRGAYKN
ncbi:TetR/AcrR family transcriptional regulator [Metabacillus herbersteinensis]|uniref:TetR/AcrR family transcriptional regulator n=1 Tax=Metabacillus herbersteinensis TaxID=283816 RepID=A0ABV6GFV8_9BACI